MNQRIGAVDPSAVVEAVADLVIDSVTPADPTLVRTFVRRYLGATDPLDLVRRPAGQWASTIAAHWRLGASYQPPMIVGLLSTVDIPDADLTDAPNTVILTVTEDAPYLVDSIHAVLTGYGLGIHLTVHPMLEVRRDSDDHIVDIGGHDGVVEAWTMVVCDPCPPERRQALRADLVAVLGDVRRCDTDREPMRRRALALADEVQRTNRSGVDAVARFLVWLTRQRFVFLGSAAYDLVAGELVMRPATALGLLSGERPGPPDPPLMPGTGLLAIGRTDAHATVHRPVRMTCVAVRTHAADGTVTGEERLLGLFTPAAYRESATETPLLRDKADAVLARAGFPAESHGGRAVRAALESLPRDALFEIDTDELYELALGIVGLQERHLVRVFSVAEPGDRYVLCMVFVPRSRFTSTSADEVAALVGEAYGADRVEHDTLVGPSALARIDVLVRRGPGARLDPVPDALELSIDEITTDWRERLETALHEAVGDQRAHEIIGAFGDAIPAGYRAVVDPLEAVDDLAILASLTEPGEIRTAIEPRPGVAEQLRFDLYRNDEPVTLSAVLPFLEHLGLEVLDQQPFEFERTDGRVVSISQIGIRLPDGVTLDPEHAAELQRSFLGLVRGEIESDGFNRLVAVAGLRGRQVAVLRTYAKYLRQIGFPYGQQTIELMLTRWPDIARRLVALFEARLDPALGDERGHLVEQHAMELDALLEHVPSLDDDRIGRALLGLVLATLRTNVFQVDAEGRPRPTIAVKLDPARIADMPLPRPAFEIFVSSPAVEGVHLRGGRIARGGLRWSDRRADFRTEILGLMKAQMVKNSVIVPVGAKGGFVLKRPPAAPDALREEVAACYRTFVTALLELTDNIVDGQVVPPARTVRHDGDDPYLVVAADKGTATFSDLANSIALAHGFWLGDAFASGGSAGFDHKAMGITARGAWESVRRHAKVVGLDADTDALTVVGIGDMSGDVFGNGMLSSPHLRLVAAFDHRHVFLDPDPDPAISFAERKRLFGLPRSSWADYDASLLSAGGGVYPRSAKHVDLSPEVRAVLGTDATRLAPADLIRAILRAPVDLLWNGGIGTYVKASTESHGDVGDRSNDAVRVDGADLRCRMVGEGGNLGFTQRARVEYALRGGLVNTDAIDNSAGVDCSDHEVNIKILLDAAVVAGRLDHTARNALLVSMTDEVAELVLADNRAQTRALGIARVQAFPMCNVHIRYLDQMEAEGWIDRELEFLPSSKQLAERQTTGAGLTIPEIAVLFAYTKIANIVEIGATSLPDDPVFVPDLLATFPEQLRTTFREEILRHRLRREIVVTSLVNQMVNLSGTSFDHRMTEETGATSGDVLRAWVAVRNVFGLPAIWAEIEAETTAVAEAEQIAVFLDARRMAERGVMWLLRRRRPPLDIGATVAEFRPGVQRLLGAMAPVLLGPLAEQTEALAASRRAAGVPDDLARRSSVWPLLHTAFDTVVLAERHGREVDDVAATYWRLFDHLDLSWLWNAIGGLPRVDRWQTHARAALRDDLLSAIADLVDDVLVHGGDVADWAGANRRAAERARNVFTEIRRGGAFDLTTLTVALRQLRNLVLSTAPGGR